MTAKCFLQSTLCQNNRSSNCSKPWHEMMHRRHILAPHARVLTGNGTLCSAVLQPWHANKMCTRPRNIVSWGRSCGVSIRKTRYFSHKKCHINSYLKATHQILHYVSVLNWLVQGLMFSYQNLFMMWCSIYRRRGTL